MDVIRRSPVPPKDTVRGCITGFSDQAAARLRAFSLEYDVPWASRIAFTFTYRGECTPGEWRRFMMAMSQRFTRRGWGAIWRIELHRRGVPHLHVAAFIDAFEIEESVRVVKSWWLEVTGQAEDLECRKRAVRWKAITSGGWAVYQALHDGKGKEEQLGWQGKQWGRWNRSVFEAITPEVILLTPGQDRIFRRWHTFHLRKLGAKGWCPRTGDYVRMCKTDAVKSAIAEIKLRHPVDAEIGFELAGKCSDPF